MIPDCDTNVVYVSDLLESRHSEIVNVMRRALGARLRFIPGTKDIWCRDYMPKQLGADSFVQFRYEPQYLKNQPELRTPNGYCCLSLKGCQTSELVIDGGNIVTWHDAAIVTDKIYGENPAYNRARLLEVLHTTLEVPRVFVVPKEPYDVIGHADGMVRFIDGQRLLVNDFSKVNAAFGKRLAKALRGFELITVPYCPVDKVRDGIPSAEGVYSNFLQVGKTVFVPAYSRREDDLAAERLALAFPGSLILPVASAALAEKGGVLNCVTWNLKLEDVA